MVLLSNTTTTSVEDRLTLQLKNTQKLEVTSLDTAIAQLQREVAELENHGKNLVEQKRKQEQESLQHKVEQDVQQLEAIAAHINALATQLEGEMFKFKEIAVEVNRCYHVIQQPPDFNVMGGNESNLHHWRPLNIWEVHHCSIPTVLRRGVQFVLTAKIVNLFKAEGKLMPKNEQKRHKKPDKHENAG
jgi:seryl-tRNA synthetase